GERPRGVPEPFRARPALGSRGRALRQARSASPERAEAVRGNLAGSRPVLDSPGNDRRQGCGQGRGGRRARPARTRSAAAVLNPPDVMNPPGRDPYKPSMPVRRSPGTMTMAAWIGLGLLLAAGASSLLA